MFERFSPSFVGLGHPRVFFLFFSSLSVLFSSCFLGVAPPPLFVLCVWKWRTRQYKHRGKDVVLVAGGGFVQAAIATAGTGRGRTAATPLRPRLSQPPARGCRFPPRAARAGAAGRGGGRAGAEARGGAGGGEGWGAGRPGAAAGRLGRGERAVPALDPLGRQEGRQEGSRRFLPPPRPPAPEPAGEGSPRAVQKKNRRLGAGRVLWRPTAIHC